MYRCTSLARRAAANLAATGFHSSAAAAPTATLRSASLSRLTSEWRCQSTSTPISTPFATRSWLHTTAALYQEIEVEGPAFAESISEGDIRWIKAVGDHVNEDDVVAEIETDKTSVEVPAPQSGTITALLVADGDKVTAKQLLYKLAPGEGAPAAAATPAPEAAAPPPAAPAAPEPAAAPAPSAVAGPPPTTAPPVAPPPNAPISSTPASSVTTQQAMTGAQQPVMSAGGQGVPVPTGVQAERAITGARTETRVKMNRMRSRIAERLKDAQNTYAMLTTFQECDMSKCIALRNQHKDAFFKKHGVKLGFMSPFLRAAAYALQDQPVVNAVIEQGEMVYRHYVDISVAVATPKGLLVPVLRNVESMNYAHIEKELNRLGLLARDGKLAIEDMEGGTFTVSNGGVFGSLYGTPIINPPQSAILGMHAIVDRPVAIDGKVEIRPIMVLALTYDHRLIDGREAVTFLKKVKTAVEEPSTMFLEV